LQRAEELRLHVERHLADLVEEQRALVRLHEEAGALGLGIGERALGVAEKLALEKRVGHRRAVDGDEPAFAARAHRMDAPCDELFARAGLAVHEHRCVPGRDARNHLLYALHRRARPHHPRGGLREVDRVAQPFELDAQPVVLDGPADGQRDELRLDGLGQKIVCARAHRGDGRVEAAFAGDDDDGQTGPRPPNPLAQFDSAHSGHAEIGHDAVEFLVLDMLEPHLRGCARHDGGALPLERELEKLTYVGLVIDYENMGFHRVSVRGRALASGTERRA